MNMNINEKEIEQATKKIDLSGFKMQDELNPKIWDKDQKMKLEVKKTLLKIADDYFESLGLPGVDIEDVTMTGSLSNYNWSKYSDVDLHIVVDYNDLPMDRDLVLDFLKTKSSGWNKEHDVKIYGYDVEIYVQDIEEPHHSTGVYSILNDEWNVKPEKKKISINNGSVKEKANRLMDMIEEIYDEMSDVSNEETIKSVDKLTEKIKKMRQSGLESGGEFSVENIVFKVLRRNGMLDRLYDIKTVAYDKSVTLESIMESEDPLQWIKDTEFNFNIGDVFVTKQMFHDLNQRRDEDTFEVYDVSPDGRRLRFSSHDTRGIWKGDRREEAYLPIDKINKTSIDRGWDKVGYNPANSITVEQTTKNINSGFWVKLNTNGYLIDNPSEIDRIIQLGSNKLTESTPEDPLQWVRDINPTPIKNKSDEDFDAEYGVVLDYFKKQPKHTKGDWSYVMDGMSGTVTWSQNTQDDFIFYATPFWDGEPFLPIDYQGDMGDYDNVITIDLPKFYHEEELVNWLESEYPQIVYNEIVEFMGNMGPLPESINKGLMEYSDDVNESISDNIKGLKTSRSIKKVSENFSKFLNGVKTESRETKEAYKKLVSAVRGGRKLSKEEKVEIGNKLKDLLKLTGFTAATILPGGVIYFLLARVSKLKKHMIPKSFLE